MEITSRRMEIASRGMEIAWIDVVCDIRCLFVIRFKQTLTVSLDHLQISEMADLVGEPEASSEEPEAAIVIHV